MPWCLYGSIAYSCRNQHLGRLNGQMTSLKGENKQEIKIHRIALNYIIYTIMHSYALHMRNKNTGNILHHDIFCASDQTTHLCSVCFRGHYAALTSM